MLHLFGRLALPVALLAGLLTTACSSSSGSKPAARPAILSGRISHPTDSVVLLTHVRNLVTEEEDSTRLQLDPTGRFTLRLDTLTRPLPLSLEYDGLTYSLFVEPGDSVLMRLDARQPATTLRYTGRGAGINNYLTALARHGLGTGFFGTPGGNNSPNVDTLRHRLDAYRRRRYWLLDSVAAQQPLTPAARRFARFTTDYEWANALLIYPQLVEYYAKKPLPGLDSSYYAFLRQFPLPQDSALAVEQYRSFLLAYLAHRQMQDQEPASAAPAAQRRRAQRQQTIIDQTLGRSRSRDLATARWLVDAVDDAENPALTAPLVEAFRRSSRDTSLSNLVARRYARKLRLAPGRPAPAFTLADSSGRMVSLSSLRGRVVYLDFWATWCPPCIQEMQEAPALYRALTGQPVAFVAVSLDEDEPKWRRWLRRHAQPGVTYLRAAGLATPVARAYQVESVPAYWLIGADGRIINANAPRPSQLAAARKAIEQALKAGEPAVARR